MDKRLAEDGYIHFKGILDPLELSQIKNDIVYTYTRQIQRLGIDEGNFECNLISLFNKDTDAYKNTGKVMQNLPSIYKLMVSDVIMNILEHRCGILSPVVTTKPVAFIHNKNLAVEEIYYKTPPHQDYYSIRSSLNGVVVWIGLTDVSEKLGALRLIPGSHLAGAQWTNEDHSFGVCSKADEKDFISLPTQLGDMIVFNQMLIHASGDNIYDSRLRMSLNFRYADLECPYWQNKGFYSPYEYKSKPKELEGPSAKDMEAILK